MSELQMLLFVSRSTIAKGEEDAQIIAILEGGRARNHDLGVTGALIYTGRHFAGVLEGSPPSLDLVLASIMADGRHTAFNVVERRGIGRRVYNGWDMAYRGPSAFVSKRIEALLDAVDEHVAFELTQIFHGFELL